MSDVEEFLKHYASEYYDPAKAHAYYLLNRQLKGRQPAAPTTKEGKQRQSEGLTYAKNQIATRRKADLTKLSSDHEAKVKLMQKQAKDRVAQIGKQLQTVLSGLEATSINIPADASPELRALLEKTIRFKKSKSTKELNSAKRKIVGELSSLVKKERLKYTSGHKAIIDKYSKASKTEDSNIRAKVR